MADKFKWWEDFDAAYNAMLPQWKYTQDVYEADPDTMCSKRYLIQKSQGEHKSHFEERVKISAFIPLFSVIVRAYVGRMMEAEKKVVRTFNRIRTEGEEQIEEEGLGSVHDPETPAGRIWTNADGRGTNYPPLLSRVSTSLTTKKMAWGITEGVRRGEDGSVIGWPYIRVIQPEAVPITVEDEAGNLEMAVVKHSHNTKTTVFEEGETRRRFTVYMLGGYAVFEIQEFEEKQANGKTEIVEEAVRVDGGSGFDPIPYGGDERDPFFYFDSEDRNMSDRILPIFRVQLETEGHPGYTLAHQNVSFFNSHSELQMKHRTCNLIRPTMPYKDEDDRQAIEEEIVNGSTIWWYHAESSNAPSFAEPDSSSLEETREWLRERRGEFMLSALRQYEDSARGAQKTATEAAQDAAQGEHSYLNMLASALDEFEMQAWKRLEQIEWPDDPDKWGQFHVERKKDFRPLDEEGEAARLRQMFFGSMPVPIGTTGRTNAAKRIGDLEDVEYDEDEVMNEVGSRDLQQAQFDDIEAEIMGQF